jgi:inner membrane protein involved in colicin E2 resistance
MAKRIFALGFIFVCAAAAWGILGATIMHRTYSSGSDLDDRVISTWGAPHNQSPPVINVQETVTNQVETIEAGRKKVISQQEKRTVALPLESTDVEVDLNLEHRQKGLLWYSTYKVAFAGVYTFHNNTAIEVVEVQFPFPANPAIYDDLTVALDDAVLAINNRENRAVANGRVAPGKTARLSVKYRSQGLSTWKYSFGENVAQVRNFDLRMTTNFKDIDFPENTLSPSEKRETPDGWELTWGYRNLVSGFQIAMALPEKLQPGPLAGRISFFAPVSLFFFFFLMFIITTLRGIDLHPMNYFFLATAFFAFHLLLAYLVDHISIHLAFVVSAAVSVFLVVSYLRLVTGSKFALREAALSQVIYLVLFSYAFFFRGLTGLSITIGSILTLFVVMQMTGRVRWSEKFAARPA